LEVISSYPIFGCGYNAYLQTLEKSGIYPKDYAHNSLLQITAELGIGGLILHGIFFVMLFIQGYRTVRGTMDTDQRLLVLGICTGLLAWWLHSLVDTVWQSFQLNLLWWILIGLLINFPKIIRGMK
jgi:O-antigen ligase